MWESENQDESPLMTTDNFHGIDRLVMGHRGQLQEVLINLVRNAIEAMSVVRDGRRMLQVKANCPDNKEIVISVHDTGPGINSMVLDRLFDFFLQQKRTGWDWGLLFAA
jgi:C4-dicarboxylate-specific signal transduction histidine kinase